MNKKYVLVLLFTTVLLPNLTHGQRRPISRIDTLLRETWIDQTLATLRTMNVDSVSKTVELNTYTEEEIIHQKYRIAGSGLIRFNTGDWIYVKLNAAEENQKIGDIAIARDEEGKLFYHMGHFCGGLAGFKASSTTLYSSSDDFFKHFIDEIDQLSWHELEGNTIPIEKW